MDVAESGHWGQGPLRGSGVCPGSSHLSDGRGAKAGPGHPPSSGRELGRTREPLAQSSMVRQVAKVDTGFLRSGLCDAPREILGGTGAPVPAPEPRDPGWPLRVRHCAAAVIGAGAGTGPREPVGVLPEPRWDSRSPRWRVPGSGAWGPPRGRVPRWGRAVSGPPSGSFRHSGEPRNGIGGAPPQRPPLQYPRASGRALPAPPSRSPPSPARVLPRPRPRNQPRGPRGPASGERAPGSRARGPAPRGHAPTRPRPREATPPRGPQSPGVSGQRLPRARSARRAGSGARSAPPPVPASCSRRLLPPPPAPPSARPPACLAPARRCSSSPGEEGPLRGPGRDGLRKCLTPRPARSARVGGTFAADGDTPWCRREGPRGAPPSRSFA
ncbi:translation initiation factor IF-2-like [Neovison vison]|uniref:translation initiation factor IF-2-like n=1 Tax=Neovison vison TaxID=452646 RepID=UPI001CF0A975|nr:translation initiation factor IF-2-like [Neogale vison]